MAHSSILHLGPGALSCTSGFELERKYGNEHFDCDPRNNILKCNNPDTIEGWRRKCTLRICVVAINFNLFMFLSNGSTSRQFTVPFESKMFYQGEKQCSIHQFLIWLHDGDCISPLDTIPRNISFLWLIWNPWSSNTMLL